MRRYVVLVLLVFALSCSEDTATDEQCSSTAIVRDFTGLDGCHFILELSNGTAVEIGEVDSTRYSDFEFEDGKSVSVDYVVIEDAASICMIGPVVRLTCLHDNPDAE